MAGASERRLKGSESRLWQLIEERTQPHADVQRIDARIWDLFGEDWAIMFTDLAGFSRQVSAFGIIHFLQIIFEHKQILAPVIAAHDGILIKLEADSMLIIFRRPAAALDCAAAMQRRLAQINQRRPEEEKIHLCVGIGHGRILRIGDTDVWGEEVNAASKLGEDTARAGEVLLTPGARAALGERPGVSFEELRSERGWPHYRVRWPVLAE
jgi:class 3 adenylate cyclase